MPTVINAVRRGSSLIPLSAADNEALAEIPQGRVLTLTVENPGSPGLIRWYWGLCDIVAKATGRWSSGKALHTHLMFHAGNVMTMTVDAGGNLVRYTVQSTSEWKASDWRRHIDFCMPYIMEQIAAGSLRSDLRDQVDAYVGVRLKSALSEDFP